VDANEKLLCIPQRPYLRIGSIKGGVEVESCKDLKKIAKALNTLLRVEGVGIRVQHLEGKEIFRSSKRKLDILIGDTGDLHRPDKINFFQPYVYMRSTMASLVSLEALSE